MKIYKFILFKDYQTTVLLTYKSDQ